MDLAIEETLAATMSDDRLGLLSAATVAVEDGRIVYVGPADAFDGDPAHVIDGSGRLTLPGFVNVHAHTGLTILRGLAQDVPEIEWMNDALGPFSEHLQADDRVAGARLGVLEALRSGVTTLGEYTTNVGSMVESVHEPIGIRVLATETINAVADSRGSLGPDDPYPLDHDAAEAGLARNEALFDRYAGHDRVVPAYGPQALDMVPQALLETIRERAEDNGRTVHMHVAQGGRERRQIGARYGAGETTVSVLEDLGLTSDHLLAAHLHGATPMERRRLARAGVRMAGCPSSIAAIDGVVPPVEEYREHGGVVGLGTDQAPGAGGHDFVRELRTAALLAKVDRADPTASSAGELLRIATIEGARAAGVDHLVGSLAVGKRADVITVDLETLSMTPSVTEPLHAAIPNLVYAGDHSVVDNVIVDGEVLLRDGQVTTVDEDSIVDEAAERAERIARDATADWRSAGSSLVDSVDDGWV